MEMTATTISGISLHATLNAAIIEVVTIEKVGYGHDVASRSGKLILRPISTTGISSVFAKKGDKSTSS